MWSNEGTNRKLSVHIYFSFSCETNNVCLLCIYFIQNMTAGCCQQFIKLQSMASNLGFYFSAHHIREETKKYGLASKLEILFQVWFKFIRNFSIHSKFKLNNEIFGRFQSKFKAIVNYAQHLSQQHSRIVVTSLNFTISPIGECHKHVYYLVFEKNFITNFSK